MASEPFQSSSSPIQPTPDMAFMSGGGGGTSESRTKKRLAKQPAVQAGPRSEESDRPSQQRVDGPSPKSNNSAPVADEQLVDQTKQQIRQLVGEISDLAKTDCSIQDFFQGFLTRTTGALASEGGAVWIRESADLPLKVQYHINLKQTVLANDVAAQKQHSHLLTRIADAGEPEIIAPNAQSSDPEQGGNPTDKLLIFCPLLVNRQVIGLVEILQRPGAGPTTQRGYLRFLIQMCELASEFLTSEKIRAFASQQSMWGKFDQFVQTVHGSLSVPQTVYGIANEGRRVVGCDRVSVLIGKGRGLKVQAVSGLDSVERRSDQLKHLSRLARAVMKGRAPVWYDGHHDTAAEPSQNLPPQIETKLHEFIDRSHSKTVAIIPLFQSVAQEDDDSDFENGSSTSRKRGSTPVGALVVEQLKNAELTADYRKRVEAVVEHSEIAIANALEHQSIFLMPLWKTLGKATAAFRGGNLVKTISIASLVAVCIAALSLFPYPFALSAGGSLVPEVRRAVYAQSAGVIEELFVSDHGDTPVQTGQLLARMSNNDLAVQIENLRNGIIEAATRQTTNEALRAKDSLDEFQRETIEMEIEQARQQQAGLRRELQLRESEQENLNVKATTTGVVVNWQARQNLVNRPVERGQNLMTIVDPTSPWLLELELPERRLGHLLTRLKENAQSPAADGEEEIAVTFALVSLPGKVFEGRLQLIDRQLDVHSSEGNTCLVRVAFDNAQLDPALLRVGTRVNAQIDCGTRSLGYVMFHEVIETVQSKWMLWF